MLVQMNKAAFVAAALFSAVMGAAAAAEVYKSVDENGNVMFSEKPPPGKEAEVVTPRYTGKPAAAADAPAPKAAASETPTAEAPAEGAEELTPEQVALKEKNCADARAELAELENPRANRLQYTNENNERAFITPEQLQARKDEANAAIKKFCTN